ncbi:ABC transporter substrate-binding protein [Paenibacillus sp. JNUCC31]|uniref:ABC transporter substrate-binding protein n=1 Tax=Paenibacillus sp. JNUCC-31 TaxID=2777983 RepID=UPI0017855DD2|nr:ABC transporter substrate-binding protein [Paenibacillus sp. JNUCC-31]QOS78607.1 ABC transporter substrate-binding protein [Paenibacillus sp. JNUCC-31]
MVRFSKGFKGWTIILLLMVVVITGCSASSESKVEQDPASGAGASGENTSETTEKEAETRVVQDEFGDVTIPVHPQRIAGIYVEDYLKALDITPVVQWYNPMWGVQEYLDLDVPRFDLTGSIEALLQYDPDLIIVDGVDAGTYEMYSKVAPTYRLPEEILQDSNQILTTIADVVGKPEKGAEVVAEFEGKIADAKSKLQEAIGNETVAVVRLNVTEKTLALFGVKNRLAGFIYSDVGLTPHPLAANMKEYQELLSEEAIPELDADHIIVFPSNGNWSSKENEAAIKVLDGKLWQSLPAVKNKHVYMMERSHWQSGAVIANSMKIDDLLQKMTP